MEKSFLVLLPLVLAVFFLYLVRKKKEYYNNREQDKRQAIDYRVYIMNTKERLLYTLCAAVFLFFLAFVFYHSILISLLASGLAIFYPRIKSKELLKKRKTVLSQQFRDALYSLGSSISAGKSVETAFRDTVRELYLLYPDADTYIVREFSTIVARIEMNETVEEALRDFAERSGLEDIRSFSDVFTIGKRSGGNMVEIIINTTNVIGEKLRIKEEINTMLAQRRLEQKVLNVMPVLLILLLTWSTGDYMTPVFDTLFGRIVMTASVILLIMAYFISKKITDIEV